MEKRIIKFKAKRLDNGEWVEGDLYHINNETYITWQDDGGYRFISKVDPTTVCQFTGLKDEEGNEIWEHDWIRANDFKYRTSFEGEIVFKYGGFFIDNKKDNESYVLSEYIDPNYSPYVLTIIGNKFDRKEDK